MSTFDTSKAPARNAYDADVPQNLLNFMLRSWDPKVSQAPKVIPHSATAF